MKITYSNCRPIIKFLRKACKVAYALVFLDKISQKIKYRRW